MNKKKPILHKGRQPGIFLHFPPQFADWVSYKAQQTSNGANEDAKNVGTEGPCMNHVTKTFSSSVLSLLRSPAAALNCLRNRKHVPCFYRVLQTRVEVWENEKCCGNTSRRRVFPQLFRVLPNFHECLYNSIETRSTCFLFLLENTATRKRKTTC